MTPELSDPIRASLRESRTLAAALAHTADSIRARTEDRDAQIDLGVLQRLGGDLETALGNLAQLVDEALRSEDIDSERSERNAMLRRAGECLDFYAARKSYAAERGKPSAVAKDGGKMARDCIKELWDEEVEE